MGPTDTRPQVGLSFPVLQFLSSSLSWRKTSPLRSDRFGAPRVLPEVLREGPKPTSGYGVRAVELALSAGVAGVVTGGCRPRPRALLRALGE